jgi:protein-disulfide isomerase
MSTNTISSFFQRLASHKKYLIIGSVILVLLIILAIFWSSHKVATSGTDSHGIVAADSQGAQVGSYNAANFPTLANDDKIFGSKDAPLKIFVYEDYTNPFSAVLADTLDRIRAESGDKIAVVVRPYAVGNSLPAYQASVAVDCAGAQGKWPEMRALLLARAKNQQAGALDFGAYARQIGLNQNNFSTCLTNEEKSGKIEQLEAAAAAYKIQGAPTIFIGREMIPGARPYNDFVDSNGDKLEGLKTMVDQKLGQI